MQQESHLRTWSATYAAVVVGVVAAVVFLALHPSIVEFFSTRFIGGAAGDGGLYVWLTQLFVNNPKAALSFETNAFYPYPLTRAWSDSYLLPGALVWLCLKAGLSFAAAYNLVLVVALAANGSATYLLARRVGVRHLYAIAASIVFANSSYFLGNLGHPQLLFFFWIPLAWSRVLPSSSGARSSARAWIIAGVCITGAFYTAVYYAIFAALGLGILWFVELLWGRASLRRTLRTMLCVAAGMLPIVYAYPAYYAVQGYFGARGLYEAEAFAASGLSYLAFTPYHDMYSKTATLTHGEAYLGAGYLIVFLTIGCGAAYLIRCRSLLAILGLGALVALCVSSSVVDSGVRNEHVTCISSWVLLVSALLATRKQSTSRAIFFLIVVVFFVFSFGPGGNPVKGEPAYSPLGLLYERFPGLSAIRAVGRFGVVAIMGLIIGAAYALQLLIESGSQVSARTGALLGAATLCGVGLLENSVSKVQINNPPVVPQAIAAHASEKPSLVLPFSGTLNNQKVPESWTDFAELHSTYAVWTSSSNPFVMVNGYSGQRTKLQTELPRALEGFPSAAGLNYLARLCGVRSVLVVPALDSNWDNARFEEAASHFSQEISDIKKYGDGSMKIELQGLRVLSSQAHAAVLFATRREPAHLVVETEGSSPCEVAVSSLAKSGNGEISPIRTERYLVVQRQDIRVVPPPTLSRASPHIIEVAAAGCSVQVSCD